MASGFSESGDGLHYAEHISVPMRLERRSPPCAAPDSGWRAPMQLVGFDQREDAERWRRRIAALFEAHPG
ncbi:hypothetical protein [Acidovorax sp.]|uniref:hypothetical protein n=1 Tax=Acidovorax sp. TaxID=1872122 RepID=UPI001AC6A435|nr:hypothetical protein [Acidovorax sp.]MBN9626858.1 hypothetical protein [Acidovorax sp.]